MDFSVRTIQLPEGPLNPEQSVDYLVDFLWWTSDFFDAVARYGQEDAEFRAFFIPNTFEYVGPAIQELRQLEAFDLCELHMTSDESRPAYILNNVLLHGLFGHQLIWKIHNIKYWIEQFIRRKMWQLLDAFLAALNSLLKSILDGAPGGGAIIELKEAIENAVNIVDDDED